MYRCLSAPRRPRTALVAIVLVAAAACTDRATGDDAAGEGVPAGASTQDYVAALAGMAPVELTMQGGVGTSPGSAESRPYEAYARAIEEWSGGKITIRLAYGDSVARIPELVEAIGDGRLDMSIAYPLLQPDRYPASSALFEATVLAESSHVVGTLQTSAGMLAAAFETPQALRELEDEGVRLLLPSLAGEHLSMLCTSPRTGLDEFRGGQARGISAMHAEQITALGMSPVSLPGDEVYEALQRGMVDCAISSIAAFRFAGWLEVADDIVIGDGFGSVAIVFGISQARWDGLPLAARQLLHDRLDVFLEHRLHSWLAQGAEALRVVDQRGGTVSRLGPDATESLREVNENRMGGDSLAAAGPDFVPRVLRSLDRWQKIVTTELGYRDTVPTEDFDGWYREDRLDLTPFIDRVRTEILDRHRPR